MTLSGLTPDVGSDLVGCRTGNLKANREAVPLDVFGKTESRDSFVSLNWTFLQPASPS